MVEILVVLIVCGVALFLVNQYLPMAQPFKVVVNVLVVLFLCIWLLQYFGLTHFHFPRR